jgi:thiol-disulfide isomerase/thioredoxin
MSTQPENKSLGRGPLLALGLVLGLGLYWFQSEGRKSENPQTAAVTATSENGLKALATGAMAGLVVHAAPKPLPPLAFSDGQNAPKSMADWKGKVILLNLWATWCTPCKEEMPDLAELQKQLGGPDFEVVALSLDRKGAEASAAFLKSVNADVLKTYIEPEGKTLSALQALGLPATVLIDKSGQEVARLLGPAKWNAPEAVALIKAVVDGK